MVAFISSLVITALMVLAVVAVGRVRPPDKPLTWGEAFVAATFVFALMLMLYGVVPNQWLLWADNELGWRKDVFGIPNPFGQPWLADGLAFGGRGRIMISQEVIRDVIATVIYVVGFVGQIMAWKWWQTRGQRQPRAEIEKSAYGRPLLRKA